MLEAQISKYHMTFQKQKEKCMSNIYACVLLNSPFLSICHLSDR